MSAVRQPFRPRLTPMGATLAAVVATALIAGCGGGSSGTSGVSESASAPAVATAEVNPPGDIPDNQAYVTYAVTGTSVSVKVPEGWAQSGPAADAVFTDKLNRIEVKVSSTDAAPTIDGVKSGEVPALRSAVPAFALGDVTTVDRKAGQAILVTYEADAAPDPVTGNVARDAAERYTFFRDGTRVDLTLSGPKGADNVDPWRIVSDSVVLR